MMRDAASKAAKSGAQDCAGSLMRAAIYRRYGPPDVVTISEMPKPVPGGGQVLVRIRAATVGVVDSLARQGTPYYARAHFGLRRPRFACLGTDFAGQIGAVGPGVTRFAVGDDVFGTTALRFGAHAEYACLSELAAVAHKSAGATYAEAAALADATALCFLRDKARVRRGQAVLINGASGAVGAAAVQLARHFGAAVTGVCSGPNTTLVRDLGAVATIDYTGTDFTRTGASYDVIFDVAGTSSFFRCRGSLRRPGCYLTTAPSPAILLQMPWTARFGPRRPWSRSPACGTPPASAPTWAISRNSPGRERWPRSSRSVTRWSGSPTRTGTWTPVVRGNVVVTMAGGS